MQERQCTWKTVCIHDANFHAPVIRKNMSRVQRCWVSPVSFHRYVRSQPLARWLDERGLHKAKGAAKIHALARNLCPGIDCHWIPSDKMPKSNLKRKRLGVSTCESEGYKMLATPAWIVVYLLQLNCCGLRTKKANALRHRAFTMLALFGRLACQSLLDSESPTQVLTKYGS